MSTPTIIRGYRRWAAAEPTRTALVTPEGGTVTHGELCAEVNRMVHLLRARGLGVGDTFSIMLPNGVDFFVAHLAAMEAGMYYTPLNYHLTADEIAYVLTDSGASLFVAHERFGDAASAAVRASGLAPDACYAVGQISGFRDLHAERSACSDSEPPERTIGERLIYTSGTTGQPKGIRRPLRGVSPDEVMATEYRASSLFGTADPDGIHLLCGPAYHSAPNSISTGALHNGQTVVCMDRWDAKRTLELIDEYRVTNSHMVPTMFHRLLALDEETRKSFDGSSLQTIAHGAAPISKELKHRMIDWWGPIFYEYFGSTEVSGTGVDSEEWLRHPGTVGKPWPGVTLKILDEEGNEVPPGTPGLVYMRSQQGDFEYFRAPEKTAATYRNGLITVGDIGYVDEEGRLYPCDRAANMIISGGVNIYPAEVEHQLLEHPAVGDVAVFGVPNEEWGEEVKAVVELRAGYAAGPDLERELIEFCRGRIAHLKCPRSVDFRDELPRAENGKLYKRLLRAEYWAGHERAI